MQQQTQVHLGATGNDVKSVQPTLDALRPCGDGREGCAFCLQASTTEAECSPRPAWSVFEKETVWLVTRGSECFRRAGGATFRRRASRFRSLEAAQRIADLLNEEAALVEKFERDTHTEADHVRIAEVRAAIAKATGAA